MTTRIVTFDDGVTTGTVPSTATTTGPTGATGAAGKAFQVNEFDQSFTESKRAEIEAYGTPSGGTLVTAVNPYIVVVASDDRTTAERTAGPAPLNSDLSDHVIEWGGKTPDGNGLWVDYGRFTGVAGMDGAAATIAVGNTSGLAVGSSATVGNSGTSAAAIFDFGIPAGATGATGSPGFNSPSAVAALAIDWDDSTFFTKSISADSTFTFTNVDATTNNGKVIMVVVTNTDTSNARTLTWPNNVNASTTYVMPSDSTSIFTFINNANTFYGFGKGVL